MKVLGDVSELWAAAVNPCRCFYRVDPNPELERGGVWSVPAGGEPRKRHSTPRGGRYVRCPSDRDHCCVEEELRGRHEHRRSAREQDAQERQRCLDQEPEGRDREGQDRRISREPEDHVCAYELRPRRAFGHEFVRRLRSCEAPQLAPRPFPTTTPTGS